MEPLTEGPLYERCQAALDEHFETYFGERALEKTLSQYHPQAVGLGSGRGEFGRHPEELREIIARDLAGYPRRIDYRVRESDLFRASEDIVISQSLMDFGLETDTHRMTLRDARHTLVWQVPPRESSRGAPRIVHVHVSFPTDLHGDEEPYPLKELEEISRMVDEMIADRTRGLMSSYQKLEQMVVRDRLTGMFNRVRLNEALDAELRRANRYNSVFSLLFIDLDRFKRVNDRFGHLAGDEILKEVAGEIEANVRETDTAGRWGGEEFLIILPETSAEQARPIADKLRTLFADRSFHFAREDISLTLSAGIASFRPGDDSHSMFERADEALYQAKEQGRNRTIIG